MLVDSHCHLDRLDLDKLGMDLNGVVDKARSVGVDYLLCVSVQLSQFPQMLEAIAPFDNVFASCGVHPLNQDEAFEYQSLLSLAQSEKVVAVGETGLDYYYAEETRDIQRESFALHIEAAKSLEKPLIIHTRSAREDTIDIMDAHGAEKAGGVFHCFTEDWDMAKKGIDRGFYVSISGIVTFRNAAELKEVVKRIPLDRLLVETDAPYLTPVPHRGKPNHPALVKDVAQYIADLKGMTLEALAAQTTENFFNLFKLAKR